MPLPRLRLATLMALTLSTALPAQFGGPSVVEIAEVRQEMLGSTIYLTGDVAARRQVTIGAEVEARVDEVLVDEGTAVSAGDVLVRLNTDFLRLDVVKDTARLAAANARKEGLETEYNSQLPLHEQNIVSNIAFTAIETAYHAAQAEAEEIQAELDMSQERLERAEIKAPFDGIVANVHAEIGQWMRVGDDAVQLVESGSLEVIVDVAETNISHVSQGLEGVLLIDGLPGEEFKGSVTAIEPLPDLTNRTYPVHVAIEDPSAKILPGMFARAAVSTSIPTQTLLMPADAIVDRGRGTEVWIVSEGLDGLAAAPHRVDVGLRHGADIEVRDGLEIGDQVVTAGHEMLYPGATVMVAGQGGPPQGPPAAAEVPAE